MWLENHQPLTGIQNGRRVIAVVSGMVGAGKAKVVVDRALASLTRCFRVGLPDADGYCPCFPTMLALQLAHGLVERTQATA
jgi:Mrp family chromosome partitioning ATPase